MSPELVRRRFAGVVSTRRARTTGTTVTLYDTAAAGIEVARPFALVCEDHGGLLELEVRSHGLLRHGHPERWCPGCKGAA